MEDIEVFDFQRIFFGETPITFLFEVVFRTTVMYAYSVFLLRMLGKRSMGQLSTLEVAIIIGFGSAVGDPMFQADVPIISCMAVITTIGLLQTGLERFINKNKKAEKVFEGTSDCLVDQGVIQLKQLEENNLSCEDLFRSLRAAHVNHLGQVNKAFFETSGVISVMFFPKKLVKPGLSLIPFDMLSKEQIVRKNEIPEIAGIHSCARCGYTIELPESQPAPACSNCGSGKWTMSDDTDEH